LSPRAALVAASLAATALAAQAQEITGEALEEAVLRRTVDEQGGASHASGARPELGPTHRNAVVPAADTAIRVGLTPSSFTPDGRLALEYDTAASHNHAQVELTATGPFEVVDLPSGAAAFFAAGDRVSFAVGSGGIELTFGGRPIGTFPGPLRAGASREGALMVVPSMRRIDRLAPLVNGSFQLTPPAYRGELEVMRSSQPGRLRLVDVVEIEDYVPGVVVNESLASFHVEALRAQAITARGYAVANRGRFADRGFDIDDSTSSQVYRGQSSETAAAVEAARGSAGLVVLHEGRILSALYSSSMGGHTENNEFVFPAGGYPGTNADPALRGIHDSADPVPVDLTDEPGVREFYSTVYPGAFEVSPTTGEPLTSLHRWTRMRTAAELLARMKESFGVPAAARRLTEIRTTMRGASGRMMQAVAAGDWGETTISGWSDLRRLATVSGVTPGGTSATSAPNSPSTYLVERDGDGAIATVTFIGGGFGHNVGMSQFGAQGRALRGQTAEQILSAYYSGVEIGTPPQLLAAGIFSAQRFSRGRGRALLTVSGYGLRALAFAVNGRRFELDLPAAGTAGVDVTGALAAGRNDVIYMPHGPGFAVASIRFEPAQRPASTSSGPPSSRPSTSR
jgi:peptidoglycan hydrolase-like amidase